ncbi:uncharacterized protein LOC105421936 isoform X2 [Amborella trichopoda]|uniref:uncharacterized protein LOC105421936 isoform X2 n=1 Tax=Amborella trichopoda TaxID=13333 RepID=UPI0009BF7B61|nr:uncharacterized protein LOC105421936 isoform X2 [Amborella trichopoda]|eukprot:XP_020517795.1 uncharacterized protein LOC105421936 isoform X2 [Amborella trichopoda]
MWTIKLTLVVYISSSLFHCIFLVAFVAISTGSMSSLRITPVNQQENNGRLRRSHNHSSRHPVPSSLPYEPVRDWQNDWGLYEDRVRTGPYGLTRFPTRPHSPLWILILDDDIVRNMNPMLREFVNQSPPGTRVQWHLGPPSQEEESNLTEEELKEAMKKLTKQTYLPYKRSGKRGLFKEKLVAEEPENCAVCLEQFTPYQELFVTPCNHRFHEDCLVPWLKSHGQCPVCRFVICEISSRRVSSDVHGDIYNLLMAMEEAFNWLSLRC